MKFGLIFSVIISVVIPVLMLMYYICRKRKGLKSFTVGVLVFFISQILLRLPMLYFILPTQTWYIKLSVDPYLCSIFLGLSAGIFEEVGRYIGFKYFLKNNRQYEDGLAFSFGHWGIEALLIVGINALVLLFNTSLAQTTGLNTLNSYLMGMERIFALSLHVGFTMIVLYGIKLNKIKYLFIAIILHGIVDAGLGILPALFNIGTIGIEVYVLLWALVFLYLTFKLKSRFKEIDSKVKL